jgi:DNA polymerase III sliding clamp (beta) subunit (PCNA family)
MAASKYDFTIEQGSSFKMSLIYKDNNNNPINLTNWCARLTWKTNNNIIQTFSTDNVDHSVYKFTIDAPNGKLTLLIPSNTTNSFNFYDAKYDLELQSPDDLYSGGGKYTVRLLFGTINIIKRFSQSPELLSC